MKVLTAILLVSLLFLSSNCKKDNTGNTNTPNPPNSFSCYINGVYWEAYADGTWGGAVALSGQYKDDIGYLSIKGTKRKPQDSILETIYFACEDILEKKQYYMYTGGGELVCFADFENNYPCGPYYHDTLNPGIINITNLDKAKRILSGTFSIVLINKNCGADSLMYITNGNFTYNY